MYKKAYYLMIDALIAVIILVIGFFMVTSNFLGTGNGIFVQGIADEIMELLSTTSFNEICTPICSDPEMQPVYNQLKNKNLTLVEGMGEFKSRGDLLLLNLQLSGNLIPCNH